MSTSLDVVTLAQSAGQIAAQQQQQAATVQAAAQAQANAAVAKANVDLTKQQANVARDQARSQIRDAIRDANDAVNAPPAPPGFPAAPLPPGSSPTIIIPTDGGDNISINVDGAGIHVSQNGHEAVIPIRDVVPRGAVQISYAVAASVAFVFIGWPIARAFARWLGRRGTASQQSALLSAAVQARLDTMDRNIDTVAREMERVSEGQRFTNKLLAERGQMPTPEYAAAGVRAQIDRPHG